MSNCGLANVLFYLLLHAGSERNEGEREEKGSTMMNRSCMPIITATAPQLPCTIRVCHVPKHPLVVDI